MIKKNKGVSNIIGTVLLLALTVSIIGLVTVVSFEFIQGVADQTDNINAKIDYDNSNDKLIVEDIGSASKIRVEYSDSTDADTFTEVGYYELAGAGNPYKVYGIDDDGQQELLHIFTS
jgi:flagellin-like protein